MADQTGSSDRAEDLGEGEPITAAIDPRLLTHRLRLGTGSRRPGLIAWDEPSKVSPIDRDPEVRNVRDLIEARGDLTRCARHLYLLDRAARGAILVTNAVALTTAEDLAWYFGQYQRLAESVARHGILSLDDLEGDPITGVGLHDASAPDYPGIAIWRDGRLLLFGEGRHRVTIAQSLEITPIKVSLRVVNSRWLDHADASKGGLAAIGEHLAGFDRSGDPEDLTTAQRWLSSLNGSAVVPSARPDPYGINEAVSQALRARSKGRLDEAWALWEEIGAPGDVPPYVDVLAASTAVGRRDFAHAAARLRDVLADQPTHIAANVVAADLALASGDTEVELEHLERAYLKDPSERKVGLRLFRTLLRADRLERADEVADALSELDLDEVSYEMLVFQRERLQRRRAQLTRRDAARQARIEARQDARRSERLATDDVESDDIESDGDGTVVD